MDFITHLKNSLPIEEVDKLMNSLDEKDYHAVLLNPNKISDEEFLKEFPNVNKHPIVDHAYIYDKESLPLGKHIYHELGFYYLQEPSAMVVSSIIDFKEDDLVLDMCAAPGGKTIQASFKMNQKGLIISNDLSNSRAKLISNNSERLGLKNILIVNNDFEKIYQNYENTFDKIILDAPCSGSGMFRKHSLMKENWSINKVYKFQEIQKSLILIAYKMLKPGGLLSYSTCSYSKEEDEDVISYLLDNSDASIKEINFPGAFINPLSPIGVRLMPSHFQGEGQYICHITKPGVLTKNNFSNVGEKITIKYQGEEKDKHGDGVFLLTNSINFKPLKIIRYGVKIGEVKKGIMNYDLHYARSIGDNEFPKIELSLDEVKSYLFGNTLNKVSDYKGYVLLTYKNKSVDIAKTDGRVIKNNYPKGLRKKF